MTHSDSSANHFKNDLKLTAEIKTDENVSEHPIKI